MASCSSETLLDGPIQRRQGLHNRGSGFLFRLWRSRSDQSHDVRLDHVQTPLQLQEDRRMRVLRRFDICGYLRQFRCMRRFEPRLLSVVIFRKLCQLRAMRESQFLKLHCVRPLQGCNFVCIRLSVVLRLVMGMVCCCTRAWVRRRRRMSRRRLRRRQRRVRARRLVRRSGRLRRCLSVDAMLSRMCLMMTCRRQVVVRIRGRVGWRRRWHRIMR